jgi:hypothetical protein
MKEKLPWENVDPLPLASYLGDEYLEYALKGTPVTGSGTIPLSKGSLSLLPAPTPASILLGSWQRNKANHTAQLLFVRRGS